VIITSTLDLGKFGHLFMFLIDWRTSKGEEPILHMTASYNASAVKIYSAVNSTARL
jgi:hypothetical protein